MNKLGGGYGFTKIDLTDAYNQIKLGPISRKRLAVSTPCSLLLQNVLPFGNQLCSRLLSEHNGRYFT